MKMQLMIIEEQKMKRIKLIMLLSTVALMLSGCQNAWSKQGRYDWNAEQSIETASSAADSQNTHEESKDVKAMDIKTEESEAANIETDEETGTESETISNESEKTSSEEVEIETKTERNGFNEHNNSYDFGIIQIEFPNYWTYDVSEDDNEQKVLCFADVDLAKNTVGAALEMEYWVGESKADINALRAATAMITKMFDEEGREYSSEFYTNQIIRAYKIVTIEVNEVNGEKMSAQRKYVPFIVNGENYLYVLRYVDMYGSEFSYDDDLEKMIASIKKTEKNGGKDNKSGAETKKDNTKSKNGINPDMKAFLDSYEAFVDKYVIFLKEYLSSSNSGDNKEILTMYQEYMELLNQLQDFQNKAYQFDTSNMSQEDLFYYLETINRIQKKILSVYN